MACVTRSAEERGRGWGGLHDVSRRVITSIHEDQTCTKEITKFGWKILRCPALNSARRSCWPNLQRTVRRCLHVSRPRLVKGQCMIHPSLLAHGSSRHC
ncbi:hypothetical protein MPTK1_1g21990 [Marchantia polymorpha subsp. ruderalis]|uniref:Uncharacterized protein n=2 Tax=Marchantia polymorpha TaxID=3197 RepID=A0AAF6ASY2_MARPO|nr:hypothetical protein MARPO_0001s0535 [Marchantia polymorpha]BBM99552.1 hypothetical protein Mp_1g21990 [Marchantia polymorpha subsp. ruderalis]|eukprot:PTQ50635.1 hypothetical protein MARPO_0001s0535 [Marchantia polymorpha]